MSSSSSLSFVYSTTLESVVASKTNTPVETISLVQIILAMADVLLNYIELSILEIKQKRYSLNLDIFVVSFGYMIRINRRKIFSEI